MEKKYMNIAFVYAILALVSGVFYRELTRMMDFQGQTSLAFIHTHYFVLGMIFLLVLTVLEHTYHFSNNKNNKWIITYHIGLNVSILGFLMRGLCDIFVADLSSGLNASISGISGIGHILLGVSLVALLWQVKKSL